MKKITVLALFFTLLSVKAQDFRDNIQLIVTPNVTDANADFGYASSIHGNKFVVGARGEVSNTTSQEPGAVYVYEKQATSNWTLLYRYTPGDGLTGDDFGYAVDVYDNITVVGARKHTANSFPDSGAVYVYELDNNGILVREDKLVSPQLSNDDYFGHSVSIHGNYIAVGAIYEQDQNGAYVGAVHVFKRDTNGDWIFNQTLFKPSPIAGDEFGQAVKIFNDKIIVGAHKAGTNNKGTAHVFQLNTTTSNWDYIQDLGVATSQTSNRQFGFSVDINDSYAVVGALAINDAFLFELDGGSWVHNSSFNNAINVTGGTGGSVALYDSYAVVGSPSADSGKGMATVLTKNITTNNWELLQTFSSDQEGITSTNSSVGFGRSVSIYNQNILIGAFNGNNEQTATYESGLVTIYETNSTLSIENQPHNLGIDVFPNPFLDELKITVSENATLRKVELYNTTGQKLLQTTSTKINGFKLSKGVYFMKVYTNYFTSVIRVLKE